MKTYLAKLFLSIKKFNKGDQEFFIIYGSLFYFFGIITSLICLTVEIPIIIPIGSLIMGHQIFVFDSFFHSNLIPKIINFIKEIKEKANNLENPKKETKKHINKLNQKPKND